MTAQIVDQLAWRVEAHGLAVQQCAGEGLRVMVFQPCRNIHQQGKAGGVRLRETVLPKSQDLSENLPGKRYAVTALAHPVHQALLEALQFAVAAPGGHGAAQPVGFAG